MADNRLLSLFGFKLKRKEEDSDNTPVPSLTVPSNEDGATTVSSSAFYSQTIDLDGVAKNDIELITRYREMAMQPEIESAIEDIINESIVQDDDGKCVQIVTDNVKMSDKLRKAIEDEFDKVLTLLNFKNMGSDIFRRFYVDGRLNFHVIIDNDNPKKGVVELRYIDPRKIRKIREIKRNKDPESGVTVITGTEEYYLYNDKMVSGTSATTGVAGVKISTDSIVSVTSGLMDSRRAVILSYLHKAIKPLNQLRMIEDASIIYKISRAPSRRIFYIDVGDMPKPKAEQYLRDIMAKYKNKVVYDAVSGQIRDDRKHLSILEDFWMPRRTNGSTTEIKTLESADNFSNMDMVEYFEGKLYKSLNVPVSRLDPASAYNIGRSAEINREEIKFAKFVDKLRRKFSGIFEQILRVQLVLKGICTIEEWEEFKENVYFDFIKDNNYIELKEAELMQNRLGLLAVIDPYVGKYFSKEWIQRNVIRLNDEELESMIGEIEKDKQEDYIDKQEDQQKEITLQAQAMELQQKLMPPQDQQIEAGAEPEPDEQQVQQKSTNPYQV